MSPTAVYSSNETLPNLFQSQTSPSKGAALAIGSLSTAEDGKYQALVSELEPTRSVEKQLLDRIVDEGGLCTSPCLSRLTDLWHFSYRSAAFSVFIYPHSPQLV